MKPSVGIVFAVALVALVAATVFWTGGAQRQPNLVDGLAASSADSHEGVRLDETRRRPGLEAHGDDPIPAPDEARLASDPGTAATRLDGAAACDRYRLRVIDSATHRPVPGAQVRSATYGECERAIDERTEADPRFEPGPEPWRQFAHTRLHGSRSVTDDNGCVEFACELGQILFVVVETTKSAMSGTITLEESSDDPEDAPVKERVLELSLRGELVVRAIDTRGTAVAGIDLECYLLNRHIAQLARSREAHDENDEVDFVELEPTLRQRTDEFGMLTIPDPNALRKIFEENIDPDDDDADRERLGAFAFRAAGSSPLSAPLLVRVEDASREPHVLIVPPFGTLALRVRRSDGSPLAVPLQANASVMRPQTHYGTVVYQSPQDFEAIKPFGAEERIVFRQLGIGTRLDASISIADVGTGFSVEIDGPTTPFGTTERTIDFPANFAFADARIVERAGSPLPDSVRVELLEVDVPLVRLKLPVLPDGTICIAAHVGEGVRIGGELVAWLPSEPARSLRISPIHLEAGRSVRWPDLEFSGKGPTLEGRCVDDTGAPIQGVVIVLGRYHVTPRGRRPVSFSEIRTVTRADGGFRLATPILDDAHILLLRSRNHAELDIPASSTGARDIVLLRKGSLALTLTTAATSSPTNSVKVRASYEVQRVLDGTVTKVASRRSTLRSNKPAKREHVLDPGQYRVVTQAVGIAGTLVTAFEIRPGATTDLEIEVRAQHHFELTLVDESDAVIKSHATLYHRDRGRGDAWSGHERIRNGTITFESRDPTLEICVTQFARRTRILTVSAGTNRIRMEAAPRVRVRLLQQDGNSPKAKLTAMPCYPDTFAHQFRTWRIRGERHIYTIGSDPIEMPLEWPGEYEIHLTLERHGIVKLTRIDARTLTSGSAELEIDPRTLQARLQRR
ncbi:MAG: hypothetical protein KDC95_14525 [Planctomycetes bacterium]|nr:hypothetical protein [Planctomycetota bacterium]